VNLDIKDVTAPGEAFGFRCKAFWIDLAEVIDSLRIFPRLIVGAYLWLLIWVTWYFAHMYFALPAAERTVQLTAFASVVLTAAFGALPFIVKIYMDTGRDWDAGNRPPVVIADRRDHT
jgi:hypothetical protein